MVLIMSIDTDLARICHGDLSQTITNPLLFQIFYRNLVLNDELNNTDNDQN